MVGARVLLVEDDEAIGSELAEALAAHGYDTGWVTRGHDAIDELTRQAPDLILLDLGLPDTDGVTLCRRLRATRNETVIVVLTARTQEFEGVVAPDARADDYLTKPFRLTELMARLRAHLRRRAQRPDEHDGRDDRYITVGRLRLDLAARRVTIDDAEITLRPKEFDLLACLASRAGEVVTREDLIDN